MRDRACQGQPDQTASFTYKRQNRVLSAGERNRLARDATNEEDDYTRNRIRHKVLPVLENEVNDQTVKHLESLSRQAEEICEYLDYSVRQLWKTCVSVRKKDQEQKESPIELVIEKESFFKFSGSEKTASAKMYR